ncbi:flagellar protein FlaG [Piscibacillus halophilus]|uniref:Flagellar protein FlaG n=1 Tax=Piscibacillus halophilus TaxID=571933 RepID=A0A1H9EHJ8_9BACI|nr:flagellar protein FlaG [Piscibacillus halophilus]SEQ25105.1 flagellar protein FlaG [Piscibacillus halophilus]
MKVEAILSNFQLLRGTGEQNTYKLDNLNKEPAMQANEQKYNNLTANVDEVSKEKAKEMVEGLNDFLEPVHTSIEFQFHDKLERYYVSVVDRETDEVVKEIPPKKLLDVYAAMFEFMGFIVDERI